MRKNDICFRILKTWRRIVTAMWWGTKIPRRGDILFLLVLMKVNILFSKYYKFLGISNSSAFTLNKLTMWYFSRRQTRKIFKVKFPTRISKQVSRATWDVQYIVIIYFRSMSRDDTPMFNRKVSSPDTEVDRIAMPPPQSPVGTM